MLASITGNDDVIVIVYAMGERFGVRGFAGQF